MEDWGMETLRKEAELRILSDYAAIGVGKNAAMVYRQADSSFIEAVQAAVASAYYGISLATAKRNYVNRKMEAEDHESHQVYQNAYFAAMSHLQSTVKRFSSEGRPSPTAGAVFSEVALRRAEGTFFAAGLLFRTGHLFEARALARMILEQVAFSYAIRNAVDVDEALGISVTGSISALKSLYPGVGRLYGALSSETHLGLDKHHRVLDFSKGDVRVRQTHGIESYYSGLILLDLADCWSVVYEITQQEYMDTLEIWTWTDGKLELRNDRPFLVIVRAINDAAKRSQSE